MTAILNGDLEKGFSLMHQAAMEDKRYNRKDTPAYYFILLNPTKKEQLFYPKVAHLSSFLEELLQTYQSRHGTSLNLLTIRKKLLIKIDYINESFLFIYCIYKYNWYIEQIRPYYRKNSFASYAETSLLFELCKLCDVILTRSYPNQNSLPKKFGQLCLDTGILIKEDDFKTVNSDRISDFNNTIFRLLNEVYSFDNEPNPITKIEYDLALAYALRNFGGHYIQDMNSIYENFEEIFQKILNAFFYIIEKRL